MWVPFTERHIKFLIIFERWQKIDTISDNKLTCRCRAASYLNFRYLMLCFTSASLLWHRFTTIMCHDTQHFLGLCSLEERIHREHVIQHATHALYICVSSRHYCQHGIWKVKNLLLLISYFKWTVLLENRHTMLDTGPAVGSKASSLLLQLHWTSSTPCMPSPEHAWIMAFHFNCWGKKIYCLA